MGERSTGLFNWRRFLDVTTTVALGVMALIVIWRNLAPRESAPSLSRLRPEVPVPQLPVSLGADSKGQRSAGAALVVFSDFDCPFCGDFARTRLPALESKYVSSGQLLLSFRHFPNEAIHRNALYAAQAASCAATQNRFWVLHDRLFAPGRVPDRPSINSDLGAIGLDRPSFDACMVGDGPDAVDKDLNEAVRLKLSATPTSIIGILTGGQQVTVTDVIVGDQPLGVFENAIDAALKQAAVRGWRG